MDKVIVFGAGIISRLLYEINEKENQFSIIGFTVNKEYRKADYFQGLPLVDLETVEKIYPPQEYKMFIAIGYSSMRYRKKIFNEAKDKGYLLPNYISKRADVGKEIEFGENNLVFNDVYLGLSSKMGNNNIVRQKTYLGHNFQVGNHSYFAPGCSIGGNCRIDDLCFIGIGATVIDRIHISEETQLGPASLTIKDTEPFSMYVGNPAKKHREHKEKGIIIER